MSTRYGQPARAQECRMSCPRRAKRHSDYAAFTWSAGLLRRGFDLVRRAVARVDEAQLLAHERLELGAAHLRQQRAQATMCGVEAAQPTLQLGGQLRVAQRILEGRVRLRHDLLER